MRSGNWRGVTLALGLACALSAFAAPCRADLFHTIPDLVPAVDVNTGGPYYAPPIPYGHYAGKDLGGHVKKKLGGLFGGLHGCNKCGGNGCDSCGKGGGRGGRFHHGNGNGGGGACGNCGFGHGPADPCGGVVMGNGHGLGHGHGGPCGSGCFGHASAAVVASGQGVPVAQSMPIASPQCGDPGCGLFGKHRHKGCGLCGGKGCGSCAAYDPCGGCGGKGCGLCGGGKGGCGLCGGKGCGGLRKGAGAC